MSEEMMCRSQIFEAMKSGKIKLEFGNVLQIGVIDIFQRAEDLKKEAEELEGDEERMKRYRVVLSMSGTAEYDVKAHDEHEAEEKAREEMNYHDIEWDDIENVEVNYEGLVEAEEEE